MIAVLSIDHTGKPGRLGDRGAEAGHVTEVDFTSRYAWTAERALRKAGVKVMVISSGDYPSRWALADAIGASCYVSTHMNAGGGDRGEVYFDYRTTEKKGRELSRLIAKRLDHRVPWPVQVKVADESTRAYSCIGGLGCVGIVYEPAFIDSPRGLLLDHCRSMGRGLAEGVIDWAWTQSAPSTPCGAKKSRRSGS